MADALLLLVFAALSSCSLSGLLKPAASTPLPSISPAGGIFSGDQFVEIVDSAAGATIYYTIDGTAPDSASKRYTAPIAVSGNGTDETIKAIAVSPGKAASPIIQASYFISYAGGGVKQTAGPTFSPQAGGYSSDQSVTIGDATAGATIYYTLDGSIPTSSSTPYGTPIPVAGNGTRVTLRAMAVAAGLAGSSVITSGYSVDYSQVAAPVLTPSTGSYSNDQSVSISDTTPGSTIYYTVTAGSVGTTPTSASTPYTAPISVSGDGNVETIEAIATASGLAQSTQSSVTVTIAYGTVSTPQILPAGGSYTADQRVYISTATPGAVVYYTITPGSSGTAPTVSSSIYSGPIAITGDGNVETIEAFATATQMASSSVSTASFTISRNIQTAAGTGIGGYNGDGISAASAELNAPEGVAVDGSGYVYIADTLNQCVREVLATSGMIVTVAGVPGNAGYNGDGIAATSALLNLPTSVALDSAGNLYIADSGNNLVRVVYAATKIIESVAGTGSPGYNGDGIAATNAQLNSPRGIAIDSSGNLFIADYANNRIRKVLASTGTISTVAGTGVAGFTGDGGPATSADLNGPVSVTVDGTGQLYIADGANNRIRLVSTAGVISTFAGNGSAGFGGDGGVATAALFSSPNGVAVDGSGDVFIGDGGNNRIRMVNTSGIIRTVVGTGAAGSSGDGGGALLAQVDNPEMGVFDSNGNLFVVDTLGNRIREVKN